MEKIIEGLARLDQHGDECKICRERNDHDERSSPKDRMKKRAIRLPCMALFGLRNHSLGGRGRDVASGERLI